MVIKSVPLSPSGGSGTVVILFELCGGVSAVSSSSGIVG